MNWESLIAERIAAHRDTYAPQRIEDAGKRNAARNQKRWRENNPDKVREPSTTAIIFAGAPTPNVSSAGANLTALPQGRPTRSSTSRSTVNA